MVEHRFVVSSEESGHRLDQFLAARDLSFSRSQIKRRIDEGEVTVNGEPARPSCKLRGGDTVLFRPSPPEPTELVPQELPLRVLYEDRHLIAIDKPAGLVVHPAAGHATGTLVNALLYHVKDLSGIGGEVRPGIVHRLDKDTSGVLVCAKDDATHAALSALFKKKDLLRVYHAVVFPPPRADSGTMSTLYGRHPTDRKRFTSRVKEGKRAVTHWKILERLGNRAALVECRLETGRTHQIRVHMSEHGHPVLGDPVYGRRPVDPILRDLASQLGRQALHASRLAFHHPITGAWIDLSTPIPDDIQAVIRSLRLAAAPARP
ncbi:MAG: RluA family pseudouridine synthase [Deltaproteobacteria bacterium]|nr:RluA family pseudouridine synthase [Deltaproteobacteria bacterium]